MKAMCFVAMLAGMCLAGPLAATEGPGYRTVWLAYAWDPCGWYGPVVSPVLAPYPVDSWRPVGPGARFPSPPAREYAPAVPAPPSPEPIQSFPREKPSIDESRSFYQGNPRSSYYDTYYAAPNPNFPPGTAAEDACSVSFWNLSPRRVALRVNDRTYTVERGRPLLLELPRQFRWQVDNRGAETLQVAAGQQAVEIVIRR
jgi:hypothetical protein